MPLDSRDPAYLFDMVEAGQKILRYIHGKDYADFLKDDMLQDAVEHNLTIFGEAARKLSEKFKQENSDIPWRRIILHFLQMAFTEALTFIYFNIDKLCAL